VDQGPPERVQTSRPKSVPLWQQWWLLVCHLATTPVRRLPRYLRLVSASQWAAGLPAVTMRMLGEAAESFASSGDCGPPRNEWEGKIPSETPRKKNPALRGWQTPLHARNRIRSRSHGCEEGGAETSLQPPTSACLVHLAANAWGLCFFDFRMQSERQPA